LYTPRGLAGPGVHVNPDRTFNQALVNVATPTGIDVDPRDNPLLVASQSTNSILDVNPVTKTAVVFLSNVPAPDGMTFSSDGSTLYVAAGGAGGGGHILGYDTVTRNLVFDSGGINRVDGIALGTGAPAGNIFGNTNFGQLVEVNLATHAQTLFATGGTRGDFVAVDPLDGSLLVTQTDRILRISGFTAAAPEPSSLITVGIGGLALLIF